MHQPQCSHRWTKPLRQRTQPRLGFNSEDWSGASKRVFISQQTGKADDDERTVNERFAVERYKFLPGGSPSAGKFMPVLMFMIAADEHHLGHRHISYSLSNLQWLKHSASGSITIKNVSNACQDVGLMSLDRVVQIV